MVVDRKIAFAGGVDYNFGRFDTHDHNIVDPQGQYWWGIDYYVPAIQRPDQTLNPEQEYASRDKVPRMPWHDVQIQVDGLAAADLANNFIQRWNHHKSGKYPTLSFVDVEKVEKGVGSASVQVIRSLGEWSGAMATERSIYGAYMDAIRNASQ
jgi:phospholipase D1/2